VNAPCLFPAEKARAAHSRVLQRLGMPGTATALAVALGTSDSTISQLKNERLEDVMGMLYALGYKVVSADRVCVQRDELQMLRTFYARAVTSEELSARLFEDDE